MNKNVLVISEYDLYKANGAAYERLKCYAKAVPEVNFLCLHPDTNYNQELKLISQPGVANIRFLSGQLSHRSFFYRTVLHHFDYYRPLRLCRYIAKKHPDTKILLYSSSFPLYISVILFLLILKKYLVIAEKNESESGIVLNSEKPSLKWILVYYLLYPFRYFAAILIDWMTKKVSVVIAISTNIQKKYIAVKQCEYIPILVDTSRFDYSIVKNDKDILKFVYLGSITPNKDGLDLILNSFINLNRKKFKFQLDIIGTGSKQYIERIKKLIEINKLNEVINVIPSIQSSNVPVVLSNYDFGLLVRSKNKQTHFGFSTKLGEYLAAGLSVIFTDVSDNLLFLKDNENGYCVPIPLEINLELILGKAFNTPKEQLRLMSKNNKTLAQSAFDYNLFSTQLKNIFC